MITEFPSNIEMEQSLLGLLLYDKKSISQVVEMLKPEMFYKPFHAVVYSAIVEHYVKGMPHEGFAILETIRLNDTALVTSGDGRAYQMTELMVAQYAPGNALYYTQILIEYWIRRELIKFGNNIARSAAEPGCDALQLAAEAELKLGLITQMRFGRTESDSKEVAKIAVQNVGKRMSGVRTSIKTGFSDIDESVEMEPGDFVVVAARPSMGKSAFGYCMLRNMSIVAEEKIPVALFTIEMTMQQSANRLLSAVSGIGKNEINPGTGPETFKSLMLGADKIGAGTLYVDDTAGLTPLALKARLKRLIERYGVRMAVIDYLQVMKTEKHYESKEREVSIISNSLKEMAKDLGIVVLAFSQLNRGLMARTDKRPDLSDLRNSGEIEQDASIVMFLHRPDYYKDFDPALAGEYESMPEVIIAKNRDGDSGKIVKLQFFKESARFENYSPFDLSQPIYQRDDAAF